MEWNGSMIGPGIKEIWAIKVVWSTVGHPVVPKGRRFSGFKALGKQSEKVPSIDIFGLQHLVVVIMLVIMHHLAAVFISPQIQ